MTALPDQLGDFNDHDKILDSPTIGESLCPSGYKLQFDKSRAVFHKLKNCKTFDIPTVTKAIVMTSMLSFSFLAPLYSSLHDLVKKRIVG